MNRGHALDRIKDLEAEVEMLREDNENLSTANDTYRYEVERLRALIDNTPCIQPVETEGNADCGFCYVCVKLRNALAEEKE
jgi:predicted RNase H-like nuclease (RuvC/YqgF family)